MPSKPRRTINDPKELRALAHPLRIRLLQLISQQGPITATECAKLVGESVANCSYHINTLAKYDYVEPAEGGQGREKPWQVVHDGHSWTDVGMDEETALAAQAASGAFLEFAFAKAREGLRTADREPEEWREAIGASDSSVHVTHDEMMAMRKEILEIMDRYRNRRGDPSARPAGARSVYLFLSATVDPQVDPD